ncbi:MAG: phosphoenolpyruvate carboxykinase (GTP) [Candidatus Norongarragalinales archaeon]
MSELAIEVEDELWERLATDSRRKLEALENASVNAFLAEYAGLLEPESIFVSNGSPADVDYIRRAALRNGEERALATRGHTAHFDNYADQGRDKKNTLVLLPRGESLDDAIATGERSERVREVREILRGAMRGREAFVGFYCLGPTNSVFSIPCVQITDSAYVAHNENLLYRQGYEEFKRNADARNGCFFKFVHSAGELDERRTSRNIALRRVFIDVDGETVYSANTQYGGNSIGLKKLAMRLAIRRASRSDWLCEHMLLMGVHGPRGRKTFFAGAFPSMCGKTSTALLEGETIVGDDIAYLRDVDGVCRAVNVERGIFGIIDGINAVDDALQWRVLESGREVIFSNVLVTPDGGVYWNGKFGKDESKIPQTGENHSGAWFPGKRDEKTGKEIPASHKNARFTFSLDELPNVDEAVDDARGVEIGAFVYGGRDADTNVPVEEAFDWAHGIVTKGAALESETTAATLGSEGVREINPMSNLDFLSVPVGRYVEMNLEFGARLRVQPKIFSVNYFLKDEEGRFLNEKNDKRIWFKWMELRCHGEVQAIKTPTGLIPKYKDLAELFKRVLGKRYEEANYEKQFAVRVAAQIAKIERVRGFYEALRGVPKQVFYELDAQEKRLKEARALWGDLIQPSKLLA